MQNNYLAKIYSKSSNIQPEFMLNIHHLRHFRLVMFSTSTNSYESTSNSLFVKVNKKTGVHKIDSILGLFVYIKDKL